MNRELLNIYRDACQNNDDAFVFLLAFHCYAHAIDDLVDEKFSVEALLSVLAQANAMYGTPFFICNSARLGGAINAIANTYADSVEWERSPEGWKKKTADTLRQCGNDMVTQVADIVGGWKHMRTVSLRLREFAYRDQHDQEAIDG